ncbi:hypothetical protein BMETH_16491861900, partial [methanotrophic bacterial endosymbiont of Bathymodiolus sp.]
MVQVLTPQPRTTGIAEIAPYSTPKSQDR